MRLTETAYVTRIPRKLQLARARVSSSGAGVTESVAQAATHAFISTGWSIPNSTIQEVANGLNSAPTEAIETIDKFMACLRAAVPIATGYAHVLFVPRGWDSTLYCDLPAIYGAPIRRYPNKFDKYAWFQDRSSLATVTKQDMLNVGRLYRMAVDRREQRIVTALNRLNSCLTRDDAVDAILDATIGLEVLLSDPEPLSVAFKLRMRAAALAALRGNLDPHDMAQSVSKVYTTRSKIVHGSAKTLTSKKLGEESMLRYEKERQSAADQLRFVIDVVLEHPAYLNPLAIDRDLLLGPKTSKRKAENR